MKLFLYCAVLLLVGCGDADIDERKFQERGEKANRLSLDGDYQHAAEEAVSLAKDFPDSAKAQFLAGAYLSVLYQNTGKLPDDIEATEKLKRYFSKSLYLAGDDLHTKWHSAVALAAIASPEDAVRIFHENKSNREFLTKTDNVRTFPLLATFVATSDSWERAVDILDIALDANAGDEFLAQEKIKLLTEFSSIEDVSSYASEFEKQFRYVPAIRYQVCSAYVYKKLKKMADDCFSLLLEDVSLSEDERNTILKDVEALKVL